MNFTNCLSFIRGIYSITLTILFPLSFDQVQIKVSKIHISTLNF